MADPAFTALDPLADSVELTRALCDIPSVSGDERTVADAIEEFLRGSAHLEVVRHGNSVVARTRLGRERRVVIAGHIDTVPINDNVPSRLIPADVSDEGIEMLWGRGTVDMKGGVAVQLRLARDLVDPSADITWIWYDNEEVSAELNGLGVLAAAHPELVVGDFAILGEPSNSTIEGGCNGSVRIEVRTFGRRAHSARAWMGENAIHAIAPVLQRLAEFEPATVTVEGLDYREGLNAVGISGGVAGNVIPDECMVHINYRFAPNRSSEQAIAWLREYFDGFDVTVVDRSEGARPGLDAALAREFVAAVGTEPAPKYGWTDVARFSALGIPAVNFGPGDPSLAHADDERVSTAQIRECERSLRAWLSHDDG
ncbi:succinyl-diaminopimelate desuccinylase [Mycetocola reblochoni]|uniref:Succinyl-diaminopimelate desuccinylase n=2 Tax=Mycetocola reblochoni TaxID=331618 RepID=A0A1R4J8B2_9MICO|nr:succinyl-diaminopimelate desuccinylase [Mycetocola reblochoni]RLP70118.1 succinyl-diaminopimelate desuccinylase [Mycetocola reblochoni]SJN28326.1 N-succinyl-L,L-diaminopimelate desuccinylase [Mycetocola reblochoni REB411]